jgi:hypothetical protein
LGHGLGELELAGYKSGLGGSEKCDIAGSCVGSVLACGASGFLAHHVPASGLEMELEFRPVLGCCGRVELAPFLASEVVTACFGYNVLGPADNGGLGDLIVSLSRKVYPIFDLDEERFYGGGGVHYYLIRVTLSSSSCPVIFP